MAQRLLSPALHLLQRPARTRAARSVAAQAQALAAPSLGNFAIDAHSPLGVGAHATVYWARDRTLDQDVAIKVMSPYGPAGTTRPGELYSSIVKETRVFDELLSIGEMHPNVVDVVSQFVSPGEEARKAGFLLPSEAYEKPVHIFVSEFLGGGSLSDAINHKKASGTMFVPQEVLDVARSVSEGLHFLHARGVAHRDVKPSNLIYSLSRKDLKLIDFSLAGVAPKEEMFFHGNVGTKGFVAPEVLRDGLPGNVRTKGYGFSCDMFSLGCVLHEMLAGEPPIVKLCDESSAEVIDCLPQLLSSTTRNFVRSLLAVNPADRPTASDVFKQCDHLSSLWEGSELGYPVDLRFCSSQ